MKIGISLVDLAVGGAQTFLVQLAQGLAQRDHTLAYFLHASLEDRLHAAPPLIAALGAIARPVRGPRELLDCDLIQLDGYHSLRRKLPYLFNLKRCVETYHSLYSLRRSGPLYARHRVAVSRAVLVRVPQPAHLIYYGIPLPFLDSSIDQSFDLAILGRIHPVKQHLLFLKICELLFRKRGELRVLLIGSHPGPGGYQQRIDAEINRLRRAGMDIHLTGDVPPQAVYAWLQQVKVLLVTSQHEGFGRMAVEALASEVPVIANPVGGLLEIILAGETGYFAEQDDPDSFAEAAERLLEDPARRREMGARGRQEVEQRFSTEIMLDAYENLYRKVIHQAGT